MLFLACLLAAGLGQAEPAPVSDGSVPFMAVRGKLIIPVGAAGHGPYSFLLDSGVERPLLDFRTVAELGLSATEGETVRLDNLSVGALEVPQAVAEATDLSALESVLGVGVAGIVPARWGDAGLVIDFSRGRLAYTTASAPPDIRRYSHNATLRSDKGGLYANVSLNGGKLFPARIDLAYAGALAVPKDLADRMGLLDPALPRIEFDVPADGPQTDEGLQIRAEKMELGGAELRKALCSVRDGGDTAVVGTGFLRHFDVFFDFAKDRLRLAPLSPSVAEEDEILAYGTTLGRLEEGYWSLRVAVNSPAFRAGMKSGDRLKAIDGDDMKDLAYDEVSKRLAGSTGRSAKLTVLRDDKPKEFTVTAEPLFSIAPAPER